jgi:hypothetical protein
MLKAYLMELAKAKSVDAQEDTPEVQEGTDWGVVRA